VENFLDIKPAGRHFCQLGPCPYIAPTPDLEGIADEPYVLVCFGVNWPDDWCLAAYVLDHVEAALVDWPPVEWGSILCDRQ